MFFRNSENYPTQNGQNNNIPIPRLLHSLELQSQSYFYVAHTVCRNLSPGFHGTGGCQCCYVQAVSTQDRLGGGGSSDKLTL